MCGLHQMLPYIAKPSQCSKCHRFGYITNTSLAPQQCVRCGKDYGREMRATDLTQCANRKENTIRHLTGTPNLKLSKCTIYIGLKNAVDHIYLREQQSSATTRAGLV